MWRLLLAAVAIVGLLSEAQAASELRLGFVVTKTGAGGIVGDEQQRGLELALADHGNMLGGVPVKVFVEDDKADPATAVELVSKFVDQDKVDIMTGFTGSQTSIPMIPPLVKAGVWVVTALAGPQEFAGKGCLPDAFFASFENEDWDDALAMHLGEEGVKSIYFMGADYQAGWEKIGGAMKYYHGKSWGPVYTPWLTQVDLQPELSQVAAVDPDAVFIFYPGGAGISFLKQFAQAGLHGKIKIYSEDTISTYLTFAAEGSAALGVVQSTSWSDQLDNPANQKFVSEFKAKYGRPPTIFAALQYDAVNLLDSAVAAVHGDLSQKDAFRAALQRADFTSIRGPFKFDNNHFPIQNIYTTVVAKDAQGRMYLQLQKGVAASDWHDVYHDACPMKG